MLLKILLVVLAALVFVGGGARLLRLLRAAKEMPRAFRDGKARVDDPAAAARRVDGGTDGPTPSS